MQYRKALDLLLEAGKQSLRSRPDRAHQLLRQLGSPHLQFNTVHVTGTCGKGSVTAKCANALRLSGFRTGMLTSPHILDYTERIQVDFSPVPRDYVAEKVPSLVEVAAQLGVDVSFSVLTTALAFCYFNDQRVDWAVIEVGAGGHSDATNVVDPEVSVITSVGLDHCNMFGHSVEEIAKEKAGVIKPGKPCVIGPNTPSALLASIAQAQQAELVQVPPSSGSFDEENKLIAKAVLETLQKRGVSLDSAVVTRGLEATPPLRFQVVKLGKARVVFDVAHNPLALSRLFQRVKQEFPNLPVHCILGISKAKNPGEFIEAVSGFVDSVTLAWGTHDWLLKAAALEQYTGSVQIGELSEVLRRINQDEDSVYVLCGSFYLLESALSSFPEVQLTWEVSVKS